MPQTKITPEVIRALMKRLDWNQTELGEATGVAQPSVSRWLKGAIPEGDAREKLQALIDKSNLSSHDSAHPGPLVPLVGYVGAGWTVYILDSSDSELDRVQAPPDATGETVAVKIKGDSLGKFFEGWHVFYNEVRRPITDDLLHRVCVVGLANGAILIKRVEPGESAKRFNLLSQFEPPIWDAEVDWAAKVLWMGPA